MSYPILVTKFFIPTTRNELVSRTRLIDQLNHGLHHKLTLISAPAGFGKTTLASHWLEKLQNNRKVRIAWLSLDEDDNDPVRFLTYFVNALNKASNPENVLGNGPLSILQSPQPPGVTDVLAMLINELAESDEQFIFVLDDYHLIEEKPIDQAVGFLLDNLPPQLHLVIVTRHDPPLSLGRLRARDQLTELRAADLRFSSTEVTDFLNGVMGLSLSPEDIAELETRTEGWIAGLQLAAISLQGRKDRRGFIEAFTGGNRLVLDFLIEEVMEQQPEHIQNFLLQTAILDRMTGPLCDALTGQGNGSETLETLERANLFIVPMDEERHWYRYHHLFADLLRQRLRQKKTEELSNLHIRAGEWFRSQGLKREAIKHSINGMDYQSAAELINTIAIDVIHQGGHTTLAGWINDLPDEFVKDQPFLCVIYAWCLQLIGQLDASATHLINAESALDRLKSQDDEEINTLIGLIHSRWAYLTFMKGDHDKTISYAYRAMNELPESAALIRAQTALFLGIAYRYLGRLKEALDTYNAVLPVIQNIGVNSLTVLYYNHLGNLHSEMAQLHHAEEIYKQALDLTERYTGRPDIPFSGYIYVSLGYIYRQWNQLERAFEFTAKGLSLCRDWNIADILMLSLIEFAYIHQTFGNDEQVRASLEEAVQLMETFSSWGRNLAAAHQVKFDITRGDIEAAERWVESNDLDINEDFDFHREVEYLALARVFIAQRRFEEAHSLIEKIYRKAKESGKRHTEIEGLILLALVCSTKGATDQAFDHLKKALSIGESEDYIRIFVDEGRPMALLLYKALQQEIHPDYVQRLLAAFPVTKAEKETSSKRLVDQSGLIEPLSDREVEVLQLLAKGLTNQVIADRLILSPHTVKTHTRNIYGKLGVNNRTQAVDKARTLGILSQI
jgi:LuxR family maltose regulon positive regulatory protein